MSTGTTFPEPSTDDVLPSMPRRRLPGWARTTLVVAVMLVAMLVVNALASTLTNPVAALLLGPALAAAVLLLHRWVGRRLEHREMMELAPDGAPRHLLLGAAIGAALGAASVGLLILLGAYRITGWGSVGAALAVLGVMCAVAVSEEVAFRGVVLRLLERRWGAPVALGGSALLFGLVHLLNPGATLLGALAIAVEAGLLLGAAYLATGALWMPIGVHLGWNTMISGVLGATTSGSEAREALVTATTSGPGWLSGGGFGPEASLVSVLLCAAAAAGFLILARRRGRIAGGTASREPGTTGSAL